jgi:pimeloyl-ACP methyl ester carboxylesterase
MAHTVELNGISLHVEDHGTGIPVVLLHGWPDSARLWRNQVPVLVENGFRAIAPDLRGFGRSDKPESVEAYELPNAVADVVGILDALELPSAHIVGHDWGSAVGWFTAMLHPDRVDRFVAVSVPHPGTPRSMRQSEMAWYQLLFQFEDVA